MREPKPTRPIFPKGYVENPESLLPWSHVVQRLTGAKNYWLCTTRPDGRPHVIPKWAVWVEGKVYFDGSPETRHARNIARNPHISLHLESGDDVVILEGLCKEVKRPSPELGEKLAKAYTMKYAALGYSPSAEMWDEGGLFEITLLKVWTWTNFTKDPTKFVLAREDPSES